MSREDANDAINLADMLNRFWAYKFVFVGIILISVVVSAFYISNTQKIYTASSVFIPSTSNQETSLANIALSKLSKVANLGETAADPLSTEALIERFTGREFILEVAGEMMLRNDRFFNSFDPSVTEPIWKAKLKSLMKWEASPSTPERIIEWSVLENFKKNVIIKETDAGAIQISVDHPNAERAAEIANHVMNKIISVLKTEKVKNFKIKIQYLSNNLAEALIDFETAEKKLEQYMLSFSPAASSTFYTNAISMEALRANREESIQQIKTIDQMLSRLKKSSPTTEDYQAMRGDYPLIDHPKFRRILGISENVSGWKWPSAKTLNQVRNSLLDRKLSLDVEINKSENDTAKTATDADKYNKLMRDLKISESVYKVLVEQTKSQSLISGFTPDDAVIIAKANAEIAPSKPKSFLILSLSAVFGFFVSVVLTLILSWNKGVFYSWDELLKTASPKFYHKIRPARNYRALNIKELQERLIQRPAPWVKRLWLEIAANQETSFVIIADTTHKNNASIIAQSLGASAHEFNISVGYFNLAKQLPSGNKNHYQQVGEPKIDIEAVETINGCTEYNYLGGKENIDWLLSKSFEETIGLLKKKYDMILFAANLETLQLLRSSGRLENEKLIIHASKGKTKYEDIVNINKQGRIEIALLS